MKKHTILGCFITALVASTSFALGPNDLQCVPVQNVTINDSFWTPRLQQFRTTTINDVFTKFEGYGFQGNTFTNFDRVVKGARNNGRHVGDPFSIDAKKYRSGALLICQVT